MWKSAPAGRQEKCRRSSLDARFCSGFASTVSTPTGYLMLFVSRAPQLHLRAGTSREAPLWPLIWPSVGLRLALFQDRRYYISRIDSIASADVRLRFSFRELMGACLSVGGGSTWSGWWGGRTRPPLGCLDGLVLSGLLGSGGQLGRKFTRWAH